MIYKILRYKNENNSAWKPKYEFIIFFRGEMTGEYKHNFKKHNIEETSVQNMIRMLMSNDVKDVNIVIDILENSNVDLQYCKIIKTIWEKSSINYPWVSGKKWKIKVGKNKEDCILIRRFD